MSYFMRGLPYSVIYCFCFDFHFCFHVALHAFYELSEISFSNIIRSQKELYCQVCLHTHEEFDLATRASALLGRKTIFCF